jgi:rhodanese-related sulfurtransferase
VAEGNETTGKPGQEGPDADAPRIAAEQVRELQIQGRHFTFIDARSPQAWGESEEKIPGAYRVPADKVKDYVDDFPPSAAIITYCTSPGERLSALVAAELSQHGFENVQVLKGGFEAWRRARGLVEPKRSAA